MSERLNKLLEIRTPRAGPACRTIHPVRDPALEAANFQAATESHRAGDRETALQLCDRMLARGPSATALPAVLHLRAIILAELGYLFAAAENIREALELRADVAAMHEHAARIFDALGLTGIALAEARSACRLAPDNVAYRYQLARQLWLAGHLRSATRQAHACLAAQPHFDEARVLLSELAREQGEPQLAVAWLRAVIEHDPDHVRAWAMLSDSDPALVADLTVNQALERLAATSNNADTAAQANFALAHAALRDSRYEQALELFRTANELRASAESFEIEDWEQRVARIVQASSEAGQPWAGSAAADKAGQRLVFIVGMPRSGTTLCEQVLSAHADVYGAGELPGLEQLRNELRRSGLDADVPHVEPQMRKAMCKTYLQLLPLRSKGYARVIDKAPRNFEHLNLVLQMFPGARVIWMLRSPLDTVLSCYEQDFGPGQAFSNRLDNAARVYVGHARLLRAALQSYGNSVMVVEYVRLVTELEQTAREMTDFIGLDFDPATLRPELNPRRARTSSSEQVRQPVYTTAIDRWRTLGGKLAPAMEVFTDAGLIDVEGNSRISSWLAEDFAAAEQRAIKPT